MRRSTSVLALMISLMMGAAVFSGCAKEPPQQSGEGEETVQPTLPPQEEQTGFVPAEGSIALTSSNRHGSATAYFDAEYSDRGIHLTADVVDDDLKTDIYYSCGYDDNIEYLIGVKYEQATGWNVGNTLHFLITADGDTSLQRAISSNQLGADYALDLLCVNGDNFSYSCEQTDYGYSTEAFFAYEMFGLTAENGRGALYICPAMRNTHDYADSVWTPFREGGCEWANASSFLHVGERGYEIDLAKTAEVLFIGDSQLDTANWLTFTSDIVGADVVNIAAGGVRLADWATRAPTLTTYAPESIVLYAGMDELATRSAAELALDVGETLDALDRSIPDAKLYVVTLAGNTNRANAEKVIQANNAIKQEAQDVNAVVIDAAGRLTQEGTLRKGFAAADGTHLNQMGYNALTELMRTALELPAGGAEGFGNGKIYSSSAGLKTVDGEIVLDGTNDQYTYFAGCGSTEFFAEVELSAQTVYNSDAYPKFGIVIASEESTLFFYIDGSNSLTTKSVGYVRYTNNNTWAWDQSLNSASEISYSGGNYCKLGVRKRADGVQLYVNGKVVFTVSDLAGYGIDGVCDVGVLSFNTKLSLRDPVYTAE